MYIVIILSINQILKDFGNSEKIIQRCFKISILQGNYESAYKYYTDIVHNYGESENIKEDKAILDECNGLCLEIEKCYKNVNKSNGIKSYNCLLQLEEKSPNYPCLFEKKILVYLFIYYYYYFRVYVFMEIQEEV